MNRAREKKINKKGMAVSQGLVLVTYLPALKLEKLSFRTRHRKLLISPGFCTEIRHLVLGKNLEPKEQAKYLPAVLATWLETPTLDHKD